LRSRCSNSILYMPHPIERAATVSYLESIGHNYRCAILPISNITKVSYICPKSPPTDIGKGLTYYYPGNSIPAIHNVDLTVHEGDFLALVGPLGCGKSTLLRCLTGLIPHTSQGGSAW
jgi:ABC-type glutathione transport system ATPase component